MINQTLSIHTDAGNTGPEYWHTLYASYALANEGKAQSPIARVTAKLSVSTNDIPGELARAYHETKLEGETNGHTIELVSAAQDKYLTVDGRDLLAVIGSMLVEGAENHAFKEAFAVLPQELRHEGSFKPKVNMNVADVFSDACSFTALLCRAGVKWAIAAEAIALLVE
ncbi:MAG: hypothetical protein LBJ41_08710 [Treponema sp.]|nr:hypothetical protein [Treponema sp.]